MYKRLLMLLLLFGVPLSTRAHEAYVVERADFWNAVSGPVSTRAFQALLDPHNLKVAGAVTLGIMIVLGLNFLFRLTSVGAAFHAWLERFARFGPLLVRLAIATSFFYSAYSWSFLGPELPIHDMPAAVLVRVLLFVVSGMILFGLFTRAAALIALGLFTLGFFTFGTYLMTYLNYLGEIIVLLLFGMRVWSLDRILFGPLKYFRKFEKYETAIVRVFYGAALIFAGITVKFLHPDLTVSVVEHWNLTDFHWLFPRDPLLVVLGAGLAEVVIGLFIIIGFEMRMIVLISLFYITLSLLYFRELVWPHLMLYGISLNLLVQPETLTIDHLIFKKHRLKKHWLRRLVSPHTQTGKSAKKGL